MSEPTTEVQAEGDIGLILTENEVTMGGKYDFWADDTGVQYHFPNQYRNRVKQGLPFVYYRGVRRRDGQRANAEYFGTGFIGDVWADPDQPDDTPSRLRRWYCSIEEYVPFESPILATKGDQVFERFEHSFGWRNGVRQVNRKTINAILSAAGVQKQHPLPDFADVSDAIPHVADSNDLIIERTITRGQGLGHSEQRKSPRAKKIGDWAEKVVCQWLGKTLALELRGSIDWVASRGETPGWDISYVNDQGDLVAVEVKATTQARFSSIELSANEWNAAMQKCRNYAIALVAGAMTPQPRIAILWNPSAEVASGQFQSESLGVRLKRVRSMEFTNNDPSVE